MMLHRLRSSQPVAAILNNAHRHADQKNPEPPGRAGVAGAVAGW